MGRLVKTKLAAVTTSLILSSSFASASDEDLGNISLEDLLNIDVTVQKRVEKIIDVPVATTVLQKDQINNSFTYNLEGIQAYLPSVSYRKGTTTRNSAVTVRGIGTISFSIAAEPSVSTLVDGVVLGRSGQAFADLYNIERVELLRGPQGMLFGKNASAGVVHVITESPKEKFSGLFDSTVYQDNEYRTLMRVTGGLTDDTRASISLLKGQFGGYIENVYNNEKVNGYDRTAFRAKLDYDIDSDTTAKFIMEYYNADDDCCADLEGLPSGRNPASEAAPNSNGVVGNNADIDLDQRFVDHDFETRTVEKSNSFSVQIDKKIGDFDLTSITAHRVWKNTEYREGDFTSIAGDSDQPVFGVPFQLHDIGPQEWRQTSEELRIASPQDEALVYQVGLFIWNMKSERNFTRFASCQNNAGQNDDILAANPGLTCNANDIVDATAYMATEFDNIALFGDGKFNLNDSMRILFGLRYTIDDVEFRHNRINNDPFGRLGVGVRNAANNTNFQGANEETNFSAKLGYQLDINKSSRVYITAQQGYKGPGYNVFYNMAEKDTAEIGPEESVAIELGYKLQKGGFLLTTALFQTTYEGFQANNFDTSGGTTITRLTNAGDVETSGVEADFVWQISEDFRLNGGIAITDAKIDKFNCPVGEVCSDRSGLDVPFSPDLKYNFTGTYQLPMGADKWVFAGSYIYTDEQQSDLPSNTGDFNPAALLPDYSIFNGMISYSMNNDNMRVSLVAKNLFDEKFAVTYSGDGFRYQIPRMADRHFGLSFRAKFK
ncbi:TonB-dependent receptor [Pleionea sediminis]|uniref:TonB-dependent receptor n=1 Tax=Pleionea sediminis TaxID=2569479 RepID=UPI00118711F0|nr:TonB-dependent receptor [Pleionea sediminis]